MVSHSPFSSKPIAGTERAHFFSFFSLPSDPAVKQILLMLNEKESFIIEDLDEHHLVSKAETEFRVRKDLETEVSYLINAALVGFVNDFSDHLLCPCFLTAGKEHL
jgi:TFIIH basal transcription factor complex TTD-A subunit